MTTFNRTAYIDRLLAATLLFVLAGCSATVPTYNGFAMPAQCTPEALAAVDVPVIEVAQIPYELRDHYGTLGLWLQRPEGNSILIKAGQPPSQRRAVLSHERCHELIFRLTGNGRWHGVE